MCEVCWIEEDVRCVVVDVGNFDFVKCCVLGVKVWIGIVEKVCDICYY